MPADDALRYTSPVSSLKRRPSSVCTTSQVRVSFVYRDVSTVPTSMFLSSIGLIVLLCFARLFGDAIHHSTPE